MAGAAAARGSAAAFQRPSQLAARFGPSDLRSHYVLSLGAVAAPDSWPRESLHGWNLAAAPDLPVLRLDDREGAQAGWVVGHPVDLEAGVIVPWAIRLRCELDRPDAEIVLDEELHRFGGRWVAIVLSPRPLVFPDGFGALSVLVAPQLEAVTSSPFLLGGACPPGDSRLVDFYRVFETGSTFGFGTTPFDGVELVPPNHVLDLRSFSIRRCWPRQPFDLIPLDDAIERIASSFESTIAAAVSSGPAHVGLTAGGDTRLIAACSRAHIDEIDFFTVPFRDASGATDARWAPRVAARFGLRHRLLPWVAPTRDDIALFMYRVGCLTGERRGRLAAPTYAQLGGDGVYVSGVSAHQLRGAEWRPEHRSDRPIPPAGLPAVLGYGDDPELIRRAEEWSAQLPELHTLDMLTLLVLEMHDAAWGGSLAAAYPDAAAAVLYPSGSRAVLDALMRTSWVDRKEDRLRRGAIAARWPELLELPFNRMTPGRVIEQRGRRYAGRAQAAVRKTRRVLRGLRQAGRTR